MNQQKRLTRPECSHRRSVSSFFLRFERTFWLEGTYLLLLLTAGCGPAPRVIPPPSIDVLLGQIKGHVLETQRVSGANPALASGFLDRLRDLIQQLRVERGNDLTPEQADILTELETKSSELQKKWTGTPSASEVSRSLNDLVTVANKLSQQPQYD